MENDSLKKKKVLIIGGSGGIGRSIAQRIAPLCGSLCLQGGSDSTKFTELTSELSKYTKIKQIIYRFVNLELSDELRETIKQADIVFICYGPFLQKTIDNMTERDWVDTSILDFALPGRILSECLPEMKKRQWGRIILFGGTRTTGIIPFKTNAAYAALKTAICSLAKSVASTYALNNITCNAILPGFVDTEYIEEKEKKVLAAKMPRKTLIPVNAIADAALFLVNSEFINGTLLTIDGGWDPTF